MQRLLKKSVTYAHKYKGKMCVGIPTIFKTKFSIFFQKSYGLTEKKKKIMNL